MCFVRSASPHTNAISNSLCCVQLHRQPTTQQMRLWAMVTACPTSSSKTTHSAGFNPGPRSSSSTTIFSAHAFHCLVFDLLNNILLTHLEQASPVSNIFSANTFTRQLGNSNLKSVNTATAEPRHLLQLNAENLCVFHALTWMFTSSTYTSVLYLNYGKNDNTIDMMSYMTNASQATLHFVFQVKWPSLSPCGPPHSCQASHVKACGPQIVACGLTSPSSLASWNVTVERRSNLNFYDYEIPFSSLVAIQHLLRPLTHTPGPQHVAQEVERHPLLRSSRRTWPMDPSYHQCGVSKPSHASLKNLV